MSRHPFRIPPGARVHMGGVEHRLVETTNVGWVLEVVGQPGVLRAVTVAEMARAAREPDFRLDPHGDRPGRAVAQAEADARNLHDVPARERAGILSRLAHVRAFLRLEEVGEASRSDAGMDEAAPRVVAELERERVERNERIKAEAAPCSRRERHDARVAPGVREKPIRPICGRTLLRWVTRYETGGRTAVALRHRYRLSGNRRRRIAAEVRPLLEEAARGYASLQRPTRATAYRDLGTAVRALNLRRTEAGEPLLRCPSKTVLDEEIAKLGAFEVHAARHGEAKALAKYGALGTGLDVTRAGERVEMDEWEVHVVTLLRRAGAWEILDAAWREAAERHRLHVCVALDARSRVVLGASFSTRENTTENAVACLAMVVTDKTDLARWAGAKSSWSMACTPEALVTDGGAGFTSEVFETCINDLVVDSDTTVAAKPQHRGRLERFFLTAERGFAPLMPGRTFCNVVEKGDYDSNARAAILDVLLKRLFIIWVCDVYHNSPHNGIAKATPANEWEALSGECAPILPRGSELRRNALGVEVSRVLGQHGVRMLGLDYSSDAVERLFRRRGKVKVLVRVDPADMGRVSVRVPDGWVACPCRQVGMEGTPMTAWMAAQADLHRRHGAAAKLSEATVLEAILRIRALVAEAEAQFGLGGARPSAEEVDRLERQVRISFPPRHGLGRKEPGPRDLRAAAIPRGTPAKAYAIVEAEPGEEGEEGEVPYHVEDPHAATGDPGGAGPAEPATAGGPAPEGGAGETGRDEDQQSETEEDEDDGYAYSIEDADAEGEGDGAEGGRGDGRPSVAGGRGRRRRQARPAGEARRDLRQQARGRPHRGASK